MSNIPVVASPLPVFPFLLIKCHDLIIYRAVGGLLLSHLVGEATNSEPVLLLYGTLEESQSEMFNLCKKRESSTREFLSNILELPKLSYFGLPFFLSQFLFEQRFFGSRRMRERVGQWFCMELPTDMYLLATNFLLTVNDTRTSLVTSRPRRSRLSLRNERDVFASSYSLFPLAFSGKTTTNRTTRRWILYLRKIVLEIVTWEKNIQN